MPISTSHYNKLHPPHGHLDDSLDILGRSPSPIQNPDPPHDHSHHDYMENAGLVISPHSLSRRLHNEFHGSQPPFVDKTPPTHPPCLPLNPPPPPPPNPQTPHCMTPAATHANSPSPNQVPSLHCNPSKHQNANDKEAVTLASPATPPLAAAGRSGVCTVPHTATQGSQGSVDELSKASEGAPENRG